MNNITFGNDRFSHYETIGGGAGAKIGQDGTSAVQVHMTNTAITDPEVLEARFPVRLLSFKKRAGSGGAGSWRVEKGSNEPIYSRKRSRFQCSLSDEPVGRMVLLVGWLVYLVNSSLFAKVGKELFLDRLILSLLGLATV